VDTKRRIGIESSKAARFFEEGYVTGRTVLIVACLNREVPYFQGARGKGIAVLSFNEATGELTKFSEETNTDNPNYLAIHEANIYTVSDALGRKEGVVTAYQLNPATGRLSYIDNQGTLGSVPAYTALSAPANFCWVRITR
jgi:6-phosphogluconolactonase